MKTYTDKLQELGIEALEENKDKIKTAIIDCQIEIINKAPQYIEQLIEALFEVNEE